MQRLLLIIWRISKTDLRLLWAALRHPERPVWLLPACVFLALYTIEPLNFALPVFGVVDDLVLVPLVLHYLLKLLPPHLFDRLAR